MATWITLALLPMTAGAGSPLSSETCDLGLTTIVNLRRAVDTAPRIQASYGVFFLYGLEIGIRGSVTPGNGSMTEGGIFAERYMDLSSNVAPFAGIGISYAQAESSESDSGKLRAYVGRVELGVKYQLTQNLSWSLSVLGENATEDLFGPSKDRDKTSLGVAIGVHLMF
jgi:opacity protein-like surface antigen